MGFPGVILVVKSTNEGDTHPMYNTLLSYPTCADMTARSGAPGRSQLRDQRLLSRESAPSQPRDHSLSCLQCWTTWVQFLDREDPLEKAMATHPSILAWKIPWTEKPGYKD